MAESRKLDCSGFVCPLPVARTKRELLEMESGEILEVFGDYVEAGENIKRYINKHGDKVIEFKIEGENYYLKIEKA
ncbi:MAG: sulfurtransferase TusA family protein [Promethearchaeota archaeon]